MVGGESFFSKHGKGLSLVLRVHLFRQGLISNKDSFPSIIRAILKNIFDTIETKEKRI